MKAIQYWWACSVMSSPSVFTNPSIGMGTRRSPSMASLPQTIPVVDPISPITKPWNR
jgi:hypothetical protein